MSRNKGLPTGKYKVPGSKTDAIYFFNKYGENYVFFNEEDNECIVGFTGKNQVPAPNTVYLNNDLLKNYHISTQDFYDYLEKYDVLFSEACHWRSDKNIVITKVDDVINADAITGDLDVPYVIEYEALFRCIINLNSRHVIIKVVTKDSYGRLLKFLSAFDGFNMTPIIESTEIKDETYSVKVLLDRPKNVVEFANGLCNFDFEMEIIV